MPATAAFGFAARRLFKHGLTVAALDAARGGRHPWRMAWLFAVLRFGIRRSWKIAAIVALLRLAKTALNRARRPAPLAPGA